MIIPKSLPKIKQFFSGVCHRPFVVAYATRLIAGFLDHHGRMSAGQAAGSVASLSRHPAAIGRFLDRYGGWLWSMRKRLSDRLLEAAGNAAGVFVFILDATDVTQQGIKTDNTFSTGNRKPRTAQSPRYSKRRVARRSCHRHVMGLLLTPSGVRIPYYLPYYTRDYCQAKGLPYRTQADLGAALIGLLNVPAGTGGGPGRHGLRGPAGVPGLSIARLYLDRARQYRTRLSRRQTSTETVFVGGNSSRRSVPRNQARLAEVDVGDPTSHVFLAPG